MRNGNVKQRANTVPTCQSVMPLISVAARVAIVRVPGTWALMYESYLHYA